MFNKNSLKNILTSYKKNFLPQWWSDEKYKWEIVKTFQDNWDLNAENFSEMLSRSLSKTENLLASGYFFPRTVLLNMFSKNEPETVRAMFRELFDEEIEIFKRIDNFKNKSNILLKMYGKSGEKHHQTENAISIYLWLRFPEKYYIYKFGVVKKFSEVLSSNYIFKSGKYEDNIRNFYKFYDEVCEELKKEIAIIEMLKSQIDKNCYPDNELKILTQDISFYVYRN